MTIKRIDHIAIVVENLERALGVYRDALGMTVTDVREMPEQDVKMAFLPSGDSEIELLEPLSAESGIGKYLAKRGEGLHHICLEVDDIEATLADLKAKGSQLIDETPKQGAYGKIAFIHPKGAHGVLVELVEREA
ncbi:MAG: methylmalonyl-CoA epimerase [Anaerolineae bacterium]